MQLIVAEKPSVARDLARVLGVRPSGRSCFEGARCTITWCIGHLVELEEPAAYDSRWRAWRLDSLPMLPEEFRLRPSRHAVDQLRAVTGLLRDRRFTSVVNACDAGREGELIFRYLYQYAGTGPPVQRLWISSLTDEAIRRGFAALRPGAQLDPLADAARSRSEADWLVGMNATRAVTARGRMAGHEALYSIGRVQTPTLAMLVERERAIRRFVPRDYWEVRGDFEAGAGERFAATWRSQDPERATTRLGSAAIAGAIVARDRAYAAAAVAATGPIVERVRARTVHEPPPLLFDLTSLQRTANRRFGWAAARTLEIAQALYERHKILTYPRTDSRHLSSDVVGDLPRVFESLAAVADYAAFANALLAQPPRPGRRIVDDAKVTDHHAIIPTANTVRLDALDRDERRLFDLVARRFLGAFYPDAQFAVTEAWIRVGPSDGAVPPFPSERARPAATRGASGPSGDPPSARGMNGPSVDLSPRSGAARGASEQSDELSPRSGAARGASGQPAEPPPILEVEPPEPDRYLARGRVRIEAGWQAVAGIDGETRARRDPAREGDRDGNDETVMLPPLVEGQQLGGAFSAVAKQTTPPPRYTEATLLSAMESAGKIIDDEALRAAMRDRGLGTPATRAAIIETLVRRAFIERDRQQLVPTVMGIGLIDALPVASLASPELTGIWEARLARIARGEDTRAAFMADIARYVAEMVESVRGAPPPPPPPPGLVQAVPVGQKHWRKQSSANKRRARNTEATAARRASRIPRGRSAGDEPRGGRSAGDEQIGRVPRGRSARSETGIAIDRVPRGRSTSTAAGAEIERVPRGSSARNETGIDFDRSTSGVDTPERPPNHDEWPSHATPRRAAGSASTSAMSPNAAGPRFAIDEREAMAFASIVATFAPGDGSSAEVVAEIDTHATLKREPSIEKVETGKRDVRDRRDSGKTARGSKPAGSLACPRCRTGTLLAGARGWGCSRWREGCGFVVWFETAGRRLSTAQLRDLVTRGKTRKSSFDPDRTGERSGHLILDPQANNGAARFEPAAASRVAKTGVRRRAGTRFRRAAR